MIQSLLLLVASSRNSLPALIAERMISCLSFQRWLGGPVRQVDDEFRSVRIRPSRESGKPVSVPVRASGLGGAARLRRHRTTPARRDDGGRAAASPSSATGPLRRIWLPACIGVTGLCLLVSVGPLAATTQATPSEVQLEAEVRRVAGMLRCPVCQGVSIADSPDELAVQMKAVIRQQLSDGRTPDQVRAFFVTRYGEWILLQPDPRGFNLTVYLLPFLILGSGAALLVLRVRQWTRTGSSEPEQRDPAGEPLRESR